MARTWSLEDTWAAHVLDGPEGTLTFSDSTIFFVTPGPIVSEWDIIAGFSAISTVEFTGMSALDGLAWFNGNLYAGCFDGSGIYVYKYSGAAWSVVLSVLGGYAAFGVGLHLDADSNRIVLACGIGSGQPDIVYASSDGTTWNAQTYASGAFDGIADTIGIARKTGTQVVIDAGDLIAFVSGNNWEALIAAGSITAGELAGFDGVYSWFIAAGNYPRRSDDWGATYVSIGDTNIDSNKPAKLASNLEWPFGDTVYIYNAGTEKWDDDGTPSVGDNVAVVANLGGNIYALLENGGNIEIYAGGSLSSFNPAKFYHGQGPGEGVLVEKFTLPFSGVNPGAMTLDQSLGTVVIGTKAGDGTDAAVYSSYAYITGTSFSDGHPTGTSITSMKWV